MSKVVLGMSMSLDGIAGPESVLLGRGVRLFDTARADLRCIETIHGEGATHLRYAVR